VDAEDVCKTPLRTLAQEMAALLARNDSRQTQRVPRGAAYTLAVLILNSLRDSFRWTRRDALLLELHFVGDASP
jgi:hypothetical protein